MSSITISLPDWFIYITAFYFVLGSFSDIVKSYFEWKINKEKLK